MEDIDIMSPELQRLYVDDPLFRVMMRKGDHAEKIILAMAKRNQEEEKKELISHIFIHAAYEMNGYKQMTTEKKMLYQKIILESIGIDIFKNEAHRALTNFETVEKLERGELR